MLATHADAEQRYTILRREAVQATTRNLLSKYPNLDVSLFDEKAKGAYYASRWEQNPSRQLDWEWFEAYSSFRFRYPKRFEAAIWSNGKLAGLALGRPTYGAGGLRIDFGERCPSYDGNMPVFRVTATAAFVYANLIGATEVRCMNPVNERVRRYYVNHGFRYVANGDYCVAKV